MHDQHYTDSTLDSQLAGLRKVVVWLGRRRITTLAQLTQKDLQAAHDHFLLSQRKACSVIGAFKRFLSERRLVSQGNWPLPSSCGGGGSSASALICARPGARLKDDRVPWRPSPSISCGSCGFDGKPVAFTAT